MHFYNPGHEGVILNGTTSYNPSEKVRKLQQDLAALPVWYAAPGDYVFVENWHHKGFLSSLPKELRPAAEILSPEILEKKAKSLPALEAAPWGISRQSLFLFQRLKSKYGLDLEIPEWKEDYFRLTGRNTAIRCYEEIKRLLPDMELPPVPVVFRDLESVEAYIDTYPAPYVVKTPYSSTGRGLLWLNGRRKLNEKDKNWVGGAIRRQGHVSLAVVLDKTMDFALEFYSDGQGGTGYEGISLFSTNGRGAYDENLLASQHSLQARLEERLGTETFRRVKETVETVLRRTYSPFYKGCLGVDMVLYRRKDGTTGINPCIEINMRDTMGLAAVRLFEQYIHPDATGIFKTTFNETAANTYKQNQTFKQQHPITIENGKLRKGYLPLCPVTEGTNFATYVIVG